MGRNRRTDNYDELVEQERLILAATELIEELLETDGVSRKELADRISTTKGNVTQLLSGERNLTLRTLAELAYALGRRIQVEAEPLSEPPHRTRESSARRYTAADAVPKRQPGGRFCRPAGRWEPAMGRCDHAELSTLYFQPTVERVREVTDELVGA